MTPEELTFTCPVCGRTSWNPTDVEERWCGNCHGATGHDPPQGMRWVLFTGGGVHDGIGRLIEERFLEEGLRYEVLPSGDAYLYGDGKFTLVP